MLVSASIGLASLGASRVGGVICCELRLPSDTPACKRQQHHHTQWFPVAAVANDGARSCEARRAAWSAPGCAAEKRLRPVASSTNCSWPTRQSAQPGRSSRPGDYGTAFMQPAPLACSTRPPPSSFGPECARFAANVWDRWRSSSSNASASCIPYETEHSGIGNWLPSLLDHVMAAASEGVPLRVSHSGGRAFFNALGVQFAPTDEACRGTPVRMNYSQNARVPRSWMYDPVLGSNGPRAGGRAELLGCTFALFTCPTEVLAAQVGALRAQLPRAFVGAHARFGHQAGSHESLLITAMNQLFDDTPESHWNASADRSLPLARRLAPWDQMLAPWLPGLCRTICEARRNVERMLPNPFICCGGRDFESFGAAIARALATVGERLDGPRVRAARPHVYLTTDLLAFQRFAQRYLSDVFSQQDGAVLHSGARSNALGHMASAAAEATAARKTASDFLMLSAARIVVALNPSTFSAVAAGLSSSTQRALRVERGRQPPLPDLRHNLSLVYAQSRMTCGLRRGRPCAIMRRRSRRARRL